MPVTSVVSAKGVGSMTRKIGLIAQVIRRTADGKVD